MFDEVARRYDLTNDVLSAGQARRWRHQVSAAVAASRGERVLDVAAGTGTSSVPLRRTGAHVVAVDFSLGMLHSGRRRLPDLPFVAGDALALPFGDASFDAVTTSFGLRNVADPGAALTEFARVTKPGGRLVVCEFSHPRWRGARAVYDNYLMRALPAVARRISSDPSAYVYLAESIRAWPEERALTDIIEKSGWVGGGGRDLSGGIVAIHTARRPGLRRAPDLERS